MWCKNVLVAYDGSPASHKALDMANAIAEEEPEARFVFVHVMKLYSVGPSAEAVLIEDANDTLEELKILAAHLGDRATVRLLRGTAPAELILRCAKEESCDLIVMGSRGKGGVKGYLGSVSYAVVQGSPIAVLIIKEEA
ncbi:MAG: universal stress protein [Eggerthellaceae bacterium]|nr:universal stress protein [Eggerthellaceae bacterium]